MRVLGFLLVAAVGIAAFEGCGSSDNGSGTTGGTNQAGPDTCNLQFCNNTMGTAKACCVQTMCGFDFGMGCVLTTKPDGGP